jgi:erythromycin esterase
MTDTSNQTTESNRTTDDETETAAPADGADEPDPEVVDALREAAVALSTTDPDASLDDLDAFGDSVADAEIVALGEATHGSREFFELKARLIRYCVEELGTRTIGFEANAGEALAVDEYVVHGEGDPREAIEGLYFWTWAVESVLDLVEWLREFNADRPLDDRVRFYGIDAQYTRGPADRLQAYLDRVDPDFADEVRADLETIADDGGPPMADDAVVARLAAADRCLRRIRDRLAGHQESYVEVAGERANALARRHAETIDQALAYRATTIDADEADLFGGGDAVSEVMLRRREVGLADGVDWVHAHDRGDGPVVCWAHDGHVAAADQHGGDATSPAMGARLRERHGDDYLPLGFTFGAGDVRAVGEVETEDGTEHDLRTWSFDGPLPGTVDAAVDATGHDLALVDLRAATDDRLREWAATERPHHSIGSTYDADDPADHTKPYAPDEAFDLLLHVAETTPSRPFDDD